MSECIHLCHSDLDGALDSCEWEGELPVGGECGEGCPGFEPEWDGNDD